MGKEMEASFRALQTALTTAPVLLTPDMNQPFEMHMHTDASDSAISAVLMQNQGRGLQPIAFLSRKLTPAERNYYTYDKEALAIVYAFKQWRCYLEGSVGKVIVSTDHNPLVHLLKQPHLNQRQARWVEALQAYNFELKHIPGEKNVVADPMTRTRNVMAVGLSHLSIGNDLMQEIKAGYAQDVHYQSVVSKLQSQTLEQYELVDGYLYHKPTRNRRLLYVPNATGLRAKLLHEHHDSNTSGHLGMDKTAASIERHFYWPNIRETVREYVKTCPLCQSNKAANAKPIGLMQSLPVPRRNWKQVSMDLITGLPTTVEGYDAAVVFVDYTSRMVHFAPTTKTVDAEGLARIYRREVFRLHGIQSVIVSDRDPRFTSGFWRALMEKMGTKLNMSSAYHPQTDGLTERANRTLEDILRAFVNAHQDNWVELLDGAEFSYNNSVSPTTGYTPFYLTYGYHPDTPTSIMVEGIQKDVTPAEAESVEAFVARMRSDLDTALENIANAQKRQARYHDKRRRHHQFKVGDKVYLASDHLRGLPGFQVKKLDARWCGPFEITQMINNVSVRLDLPDTLKKRHNAFHVSVLRPYHDGSEQFPEREVRHRPPPLDVEDDEGTWHEIDDVLSHKKTGGQIQYLVTWKGYDPSFTSYVTKDELTEVASKEYEQRLQRRAQQQQTAPARGSGRLKTKPATRVRSVSPVQKAKKRVTFSEPLCFLGYIP